MSLNLNVADKVAPSFDNMFWNIIEHKYSHYWFKGGRGSTKSSFISIMIPLLLMQNENYNATILRKVGNTLKRSVFNQILWALDELQIIHLFKATNNPMEITYKETGQKILFTGCDDPTKVKSIKFKKGYSAINWFEELDQFGGMLEIGNLLKSLNRGGDKFWNFYSYNPPISRNNWVNEECLIEKKNRIIHHSTYLDVPHKWLGDLFFEDAEIQKQNFPKLYEWEYMGIATGTGGEIFSKVVERPITDEEISHMDTIYQGVDWGWYPDAYAFVRLYLDKQHLKIYFIDEIYVWKTGNDTTASMIKKRKYYDYVLTCDSNENKSVTDYRENGLNARAAIKGPGSLDYSMKWLQKYTLIFDKRRTPKTFWEFKNYEYERNKNNEIITGYPDKDDHAISATRYALECVWRRRWNRA